MDTQEEKQASVQGLTGTYTFNASTGGIHKFFGELEVSWTISAGRITFTTLRYKIDKTSNGGGNSANINITLHGNPKTGPSKDNCIQNAIWQPWATSTSTAISGEYINADVEFIFDKSGAADPKVTKRLAIYP